MIRNTEAEFRETYLRWRKQLAALLRDADTAERITRFMDADPLWAKFIKPLLEEQIRAWETNHSWTAPITSVDGNPSLEELRGMAKQSRHLLRAFDMRHGTRDTILGEVEKVRSKMAAARKAGNVKPEWDDESI